MTEFLTPGRLRSLDEVFFSKSLPTASGKKAAQARQDSQLAGKLCHDAWDLARRDESLTSFDRVVERLLKVRDYGVRKTKAKALISMIEASQSQFLGKELSLSRFLEQIGEKSRHKGLAAVSWAPMRQRFLVKGGLRMLRLPKLIDLANFVCVLDKHPFGALVLVLLVTGIGLTVWAATH